MKTTRHKIAQKLRNAPCNVGAERGRGGGCSSEKNQL